jgi:transposase
MQTLPARVKDRAVEELLEEVLGASLSLGTVMAREREMTQALSEPYRQAKQMIQKASAKNVDETGWKHAGRFLWVAATRSLAVFHLDPCRNRDAMHELLGRKINGTICTDRFGVYEKVPVERRGLCWSHLKRDFKDLAEQKGPARKIGDASACDAGAEKDEQAPETRETIEDQTSGPVLP